MFRRNKNGAGSAKPPVKLGTIRRDLIPSVITRDVNVLGNIVSEGTLDLDGNIQGNIRCNSLTLRAGGSVAGDISADVVHIYGKVKGVIRVRSANFYNGCHVDGIIMHETLVIEDGARVDGKFKRTDKSQSIADESSLGQPFLMLEGEDSEEGEGGELLMSPRPFDKLRLISQ